MTLRGESALACVEIMLRSHVARVIADEHGAYGGYLEEGFYTDVGDREPTVESCLRDISGVGTVTSSATRVPEATAPTSAS